MNTDFLKTNLHFKEGIKGVYYKKIDGFLYTIDPTDENETVLYINLPETQEENKKALIQFLKDNIKKFLKARIVKNGVKLTLNSEILNKKSSIVKVAQQISAYLREINVIFENKKHEIDFKNNMYVFADNSVTYNVEECIEVSEEINIMQENEPAPEETQLESEKKEFSFKNFFSAFFNNTQFMLISIYVISAIIFILLSLISINLAAVSGYLMGWLPAEYLVKRKYENKKIFLLITLCSFITLLITGSYSFLYMFLSQNEIYTVSEFFLQSLSPAYCGFNIILGLLLSMFGTYSTLPAKPKPKVEKDEDFE